MSLRARVARNVLWNWVGLGTGMVAGVLVAPFLVQRLGDTVYGVWVLIASVTGYFGLLDLGTRGAVGRNIAFFRAKGDREGENAILSTGAAILGGIACLTLCATFLVSVLFFRLFTVPPEEVSGARLALQLVGINVAVTLALSVFDALLWACQRFDILSGLKITGDVTRLVLTFYLIGSGHGVVTLAVLTLATTVVTEVTKVGAALWVDPGLRLKARLITRDAARRLFGYGLWNSLLSVGRMVTKQSAPLIIGSRLEVSLVTPYAIALRLVDYGASVLACGADALTPVTTSLHAADKRQEQHRLFLEGGRYNLLLSLFFMTLLVVLGKPFIRLWIGPAFDVSFPILVILALGEALPASQMISRAVILGMGRPKLLAWTNVAENVVAIGAAVAVVSPYGLVGVATAFALCGAVGRGIVQLLVACHLVQLPWTTFVRRAVLPALAGAALPAMGLVALLAMKVPSTWLLLIAYAAAYGVFYLVACAVLVGYDRIGVRRRGGLAGSAGREKEEQSRPPTPRGQHKTACTPSPSFSP